MSIFFFFNDTATTEIYTLSLHDALPISRFDSMPGMRALGRGPRTSRAPARSRIRTIFFTDRKSTRLNSSHLVISYAVFCLKKKKKRYFYVQTSSSVLLCSNFDLREIVLV